MALTSSYILLSLIVLLYSCHAKELCDCHFSKIFQFGDSISDVGNSIIEVPQAYHSHFPYGETIGRATGRPSDGLLMIDFIAQLAGLPFTEASLNKSATFEGGVNFAVAGVTALSKKALAKWNISLPYTNSTLDVQIGWFDGYLQKFCTDPSDCKEKLKLALFMVGLIGPNDYSGAFSKGYTIKEVKRTMVPAVVDAIKSATVHVIEAGATRVVVPGSFPLACSPSYLTMFQGNAYDKFHCLVEYNDFFKYHNSRLQHALQELRTKYPHVYIVYGDIYGAMQFVFDNLSNFGFKWINKTCCGIGGAYNFDPAFTKTCGAPGVPFCTNPEEYVFFDGGHPTHMANMRMVQWLAKDMLPKLGC